MIFSCQAFQENIVQSPTRDQSVRSTESHLLRFPTFQTISTEISRFSAVFASILEIRSEKLADAG